MSDQEYTPKSKAGKWFNDRLPLLTLGSHLTDYPTPKNMEVPNFEFVDNNTIKIG